MNLQDILGKYGVPDPSIVGKLPRGGITLDFVGHAEITKILIEIDPNWSWQPVSWTEQGRPAINVINGMAVMWGELTVLGQTRLGVGSARHDKPDLDKELIGDFLRNAAMRFGISLSLWSKSEWEEQQAAPRKTAEPKPVGQDFVTKFREACAKKGINPDDVAKAAGVNLAEVTDADAPKLRDAFKQMDMAKSIELVDKQQIQLVSTEEQIKHVFGEQVKVVAQSKPDNPTPKNPGEPATKAQIGKIRALLNAKGIQSFTEKTEVCADLINRPINKLEQMTQGEASQCIDILDARVS
jgi:hypothetical protein